VLTAYVHAKHLIVRPPFAWRFASFLDCCGRDSDMDAVLFEVAIEPAVLNTATAGRKTLMQLSNEGKREKTLGDSQQKFEQVQIR